MLRSVPAKVPEKVTEKSSGSRDVSGYDGIELDVT